MSDLISRDALIARIQTEGKHQASQNANRYDPIVLAYGDCYAMAKTAPAVDAVEVKHGEWISAERGYFFHKCDDGQIVFGLKSWHYCPNCGADMRGAT